MLLKIAEVPEFLHKSDRYISTYEIYGEESEFKVGGFYPPKNEDVKNLEDFKLLFHTYDIWVHPRYGHQFIEFIETNRDEVLDFLFNIAGQFTQAKILLKEIMDSQELKFSIDLEFESNLYRSKRYRLKSMLQNNVFKLNLFDIDLTINNYNEIEINTDIGFYGDFNVIIERFENFTSKIKNEEDCAVSLSDVNDTYCLICMIYNNKMKFIINEYCNVEHEYKVTKFNRSHIVKEFEKIIEKMKDIRDKAKNQIDFFDVKIVLT